ncbi:MAG: hypothetical protein ACTSV7_10205 [Candidatus Baldrarchaeia archaeon]
MSYGKSIIVGIISIPVICLFTIVTKMLPSDVLYHFQGQSISSFPMFIIGISEFILFSQERIFSWLIWYTCGLIAGLAARGTLKGVLSAFSIPIVWSVLYWVLFILLSTEISMSTWGIINELYILTDITIRFGVIAAAGGGLGGAATRQR